MENSTPMGSTINVSITGLLRMDIKVHSIIKVLENIMIYIAGIAMDKRIPQISLFA
jgi:hypothetical protein